MKFPAFISSQLAGRSQQATNMTTLRQFFDRANFFHTVAAATVTMAAAVVTAITANTANLCVRWFALATSERERSYSFLARLCWLQRPPEAFMTSAASAQFSHFKSFMTVYDIFVCHSSEIRTSSSFFRYFRHFLTHSLPFAHSISWSFVAFACWLTSWLNRVGWAKPGHLVKCRHGYWLYNLI